MLIALNCKTRAGHGAWLMLWRITIDMQYTQLAAMTDAQYQGVEFPDIVQLAFLGDTCQYIAGCSSMGSLAIWHSRCGSAEAMTTLQS